MNSLIEQAAKHWQYVAPLLTPPASEAQYDALVESLDQLLALVAEDELHPLASLMVHVADLLEAYDQKVRRMPIAPSGEVLRYLMNEHSIKQSELPEVGTQSVISEILSGKRSLNVRQIGWLSKHFRVPPEVFFPSV